MPTTVDRARNGRVALAYETFGPQDGEPLLLIAGFSVQRHFWPDDFCHQLVDHGFRVARFDNRDAGESTHLDDVPAPTMASLVMTPDVAPYYLADMADDAAAVLDAIGWDSAHVVGISMGGMIAQTLAITHPHRVRSLTSISSTPSPRIGRPTLAASRIMLMPPPRTAEALANRMVRQFRVIGSPAYPVDEPWLRDYAVTAFARGYDARSGRRQLAAVMASGSRTGLLPRVRVPSLVVHGSADQLIRPWAGRATANALKGSRFVEHPGMGHDLPTPLWGVFAADVARTASSVL